MSKRYSDEEILALRARAKNLGAELMSVIDEIVAKAQALNQELDDAAVRTLAEAEALGHEHRAADG